MAETATDTAGTMSDAERQASTAGTMSDAERQALVSAGTVGLQDIDLGGMRSLDETEAGEEAIPIEDLADTFLIVSAYVTPVTWPTGDDGEVRAGFTSHMLCMTDPSRPSHMVEVYSNSDAIAAKLQTLIERDNLSPSAPVLVKFAEKPTRNFKVHKLTNPTKAEVTAFKSAIAAASK